jgi:TATA-binding protein-associated factor
LASHKLPVDDIENSGKLKGLKQLLIDCGIGDQNDRNSSSTLENNIVSSHRVLIFAQFKTTLDLIESDLLKGILIIKFVFLRFFIRIEL